MPGIPRSDIETPYFYDIGRIISPDSPAGLLFTQQMEGLTKRLLSNRYNPEKYNYRFLLADNPELNAYAITTAKPPVFVIYKGLLEQAHSLDELAGVVAHELGHQLAQEELGDHSNSKAEEWGADAYALKLLSEAGFNGRAIENLSSRIGGDGADVISNILQSLFDVHPLTHNRVSALEKERIAMERKGYIIERPDTPLPQEWLSNSRSANYHSTSDIPAYIQQSGYETMPVSEKLEWLAAQAERLSKVSSEGIEGKARILYRKQLQQEFAAISVANFPELHENYQAAFDRLLASGLWDGSNSNVLYEKALLGLGIAVDKLQAIGIFRELKAEIYAYADAKTLEAALPHAQRIIAIYETYKVALQDKNNRSWHGLLEKTGIEPWKYTPLNVVRQQVSNGEPVNVPLLQHEYWAEANPALKDVNKLLLGGYRGWDTPPLVYPDSGIGYGGRRDYLEALQVSEGKVIAMRAEPIKAFNRPGSFIDKGYWTEKLQWEQNILKEGVNWDLLKTNPDEFIRIYRAALRPEQSRWPYPHPFAQAMMEYIHNQALSDPEVMTTKFRAEFFNKLPDTGIVPSVDTGIDIDHPYIKEYQFLRAAGHELTSRLIKDIRINALDDNGPIPVTREEAREAARKSRRDAETAITQVYNFEDARQRLKEYDANGTPGSALGELVSMRENLREIKDYFITEKTEFSVARKRRKVINSALATCDKHLEAVFKLASQQPIEMLIQDYQHADFEYQDLYDLKNRWGRLLVNKVAAIKEPLERRAHLRQLLEWKDKWDKEKKFESPDPETRKKLSALIISDIHHQMENLQDDTSAEYKEKLVSLIEEYPISGQLHSEIVRGIADKVVAQPELARELRRVYYKNATQTAFEGDNQTRLAETIFESVKGDVKMRAGTLEFLSKPLSEASIRAMYQVILKSDANQGITFLGKDKTALELAGYTQTRDTLEKFHKSFWDYPLPIRTSILTDIIFPQGTSNEAAIHITGRIIDRLLGSDGNRRFSVADFQTLSERTQGVREKNQEELRIEIIRQQRSKKRDWENDVPTRGQILKTQLRNSAEIGFIRAGDAFQRFNHQLNHAGNTLKPGVNQKNAETAKLIVKSYIETVGSHNPKEAQMLVSALLSAEHQRAPGQPLRLGQTLNIVLSNMGPAGAKLLQAIHSNPSTPEDIRNDLKFSKIEHDKPATWDAIELMETAGLLDPAKTAYVGKCIGAGSFGITMLNMAPDGKKYADTLLRTNAEAMADREFEFMEKAAQIVAQNDPRMKPIIEMVKQARHSAQIETQMSLAEKQNDIARQSMDGVAVKIKGTDGVVRSYTHHVMPLIEQNEHYKRAEFAPGTEYLKLPKNTSVGYRRDIAYAMASMHLTQRFAGMPMDRDRHGGNIKVEGNHIYHYDFGMTDLELPSNTQKQALGRVLAQTVKQVAKNQVNPLTKILKGKKKSFVDALVNNIDKSDAEPSERAFLTKFKQEVLAMADYFNALEDTDKSKTDSKQAMEGIMGQALYGERVDPYIQEAFTQELGSFGASLARKHFATAIANSPVAVENLLSVEQLVMPKLSEKEAAIVAQKYTAKKREGIPNENLSDNTAVESAEKKRSIAEPEAGEAKLGDGMAFTKRIKSNSIPIAPEAQLELQSALKKLAKHEVNLSGAGFVSGPASRTWRNRVVKQHSKASINDITAWK